MGLTVIDAGVLIGYLEPADAHHSIAERTLLAARNRRDEIVLPASAYSECLVDPSRRGPEAVEVVRTLTVEYPISVRHLDEPVAEAAARLRASHAGLRLPDALVIGTAQVLEADTLITTDHRWPAAADLPFEGNLIRL